jgi:hypothetical protein
MFMTRPAYALICLLLAWGSTARAEIYKFVDENGHVTYTNIPRAGAKKLDLGQAPNKAPVADAKTGKKRTGTATPSYFPRVDAGTQKKRDDMRRQLLTEELDSEQRNLRAAESAYSSGRAQPGSDVKHLFEAVRLHQKNIEMLNKELSHLK